MGDTPTKQYRVTKDSTEARQDAEIMALRADFAEHQSNFADYRTEDRAVHKELGAGVANVANTLGKYTFAGKIVWGLVGVFLASLAGLFGWQTARIGHLHDKMDSLNARLSKIEAIDQHLDTDLGNLRYQIRELRKYLDRNGGREE